HQPVRRAVCGLFRRLARLEQLALRPDRPAACGERVAHPRLLSRDKDAKGGAGGNSRALFPGRLSTGRDDRHFTTCHSREAGMTKPSAPRPKAVTGETPSPVG